MLKNPQNFQLNWTTKSIGLLLLPIIAFLLFSNLATAQSEVINVDAFDKIIVSPHIEVVFKEGQKESVSIESITVPMEKLNVKVKNNTLHVYLDGAKITAERKKDNSNSYQRKVPIYKGTVVKAIITYKNINSLDLRGEEKFVFEDNINTKELTLRIFGESQTYMNEVNIQNVQTALYGESYLEIKQGKIENLKITGYGESEVNTLNVDNKAAKITAYGEGVYELNVSEKLKVTAYGEATVNYSGNPSLHKGIVIGEAEISEVRGAKKNSRL